MTRVAVVAGGLYLGFGGLAKWHHLLLHGYWSSPVVGTLVGPGAAVVPLIEIAAASGLLLAGESSASVRRLFAGLFLLLGAVPV